MGSSPILAQGAPGSSVGRARTQRQMHLVLYRGEDKRLSHGSHYPWGAGSTPATATTWQGRLMVGRQTHYLVIWVQLPTSASKSVWAYLTLIKMPDSVNTDLVSFNYH